MTVPESQSNHNLLFGILALQLDFISREQLVAATSKWLMDKTSAIEYILLELGVLTEDDRNLLVPLVARHIENHDGDVEKSLAAVNVIGSLHEELTGLGDPHIETSLSIVSVNSDKINSVEARASQDDPDATLMIGRPNSSRLRFRILRPHAKGGLGEVYVAQDLELNREVALKQIQERFADAPDSRSRFVVEAEIAGALEHPGIVPVYGLGHYADGRPFYAMRFIRGDSLKEAIDDFHRSDSSRDRASDRTLELRKLLGRFVDVCNAVEYAHSRGVLHRDLKPGNVMLGKYGETLVVDWGLAKAVGREDVAATDERTLRPGSGSGSAPTQMGSALGTPAFMSPEQAAGRIDQLGPPSDVYSLGATLYNLLTGTSPFTDKDLSKVLTKVQSGDFRRPQEVNPSVPKPLEAVCLKAMSLQLQDRYKSPTAIADDIENWLADESVSAWTEPITWRAARWTRKHRVSTTIAAATALLLLVTGLILWNAAARRQQREARHSKELADQQQQQLKAMRIEAEASVSLAESELAQSSYSSALRLLTKAVNSLSSEAEHRSLAEDIEVREDRLRHIVDFYPSRIHPFLPANLRCCQLWPNTAADGQRGVTRRRSRQGRRQRPRL